MPASFGEMQRVTVPFRKVKQLMLVFCFVFVLWICVVTYSRKHNGAGVPNMGLVAYGYVPTKPLEVLEKEQEDRKKLVQDVCNLAGKPDGDAALKDRQNLDHIIVDDDHQLLYCYVPKVACTNWKRVLMVLTGKSNTSDPLSIVADDSHRLHVFRRLSNYSVSEALHRIDHYTKFMFVRHPLERLLSAFRNKFQQNYASSEYFRSRYGKLIIKQFRPNASNESLVRGHDVTFSEFVQYIIDPKTVSRSVFNEHWRPMYDLCLPCHIKYDIIGKYENLMDDSWLVLEKTNLSHLIQFPRSDKPSATNSLLTQYLDSLTEEQLLHLYHVFELDFRLYDYSFPGQG